MGVHWCGWCGNMSGGGLCDDGCYDEFEKLEEKLKSMISDEAWEIHEKLMGVIMETY